MAIIQPIDYRGYLNQGRQTLGADLATIGTALGQAFAKNKQEEAAALAAAQYASDVKSALDNPSPQAFAGLALKYPKQREAFKQGWDQLSEGDRKAESDLYSQAYSALLAGKSDIAADVVQRQIDARKNSGLDTSQYDNALKLIKESPDGAKAALGFTLAHISDPKTFASQFAALGKEQREQQLQAPAVDLAYANAQEAQSKAIKAAAEAEVAQGTTGALIQKPRLENLNVSSQIRERAARLGLDQDKLTSETQLKIAELQQKAGTLPDSALKIVNEAASASVAADQSAAQSLELANKFDRLGGGTGVGATIAEKWASATGRQDALSAARQEYIRLRNSAAIKSLPPGPATDKDIDLALKGFPPENADSAYIASFMRGMAKIQQREAVYENARSEWVNAVGNMGKSKTDIEVDGVRVPRGATFVDFSRKYLDAKTQARANEQNAQQAQQRSYQRFATPGGQ